MCGRDAAAKDLAQEAFLRVFRAFRRLPPAAALGAWLYRIVTNLYTDLLREPPKGRVESISAPITTPQGSEMQREWPAPEADSPEATIDAQMDATVQQVLLALPADLRMVVVLSDIEGFAYEEIARMLEVALGAGKAAGPARLPPAPR